MTPGQVVEVGRNDCAVPPGTRGVWLGVVPETGNALVLLAGGRRVALTEEQWRPEGGAWPGPRTLAGEPPPPPARRSPRRVGCSVEGCDGRHMARGLCSKHYEQRRRAERRRPAPPDPPKPKPAPVAKPKRLCAVPGCGRPHRAHGWCHTHYRRYLATGDPLATRRPGPVPCAGPCSVPGCGRRASGRGLCPAHASRLRRHGDVMADVPVGQRTGRVAAVRAACAVGGCGRPSHARGLCSRHYSRGRRLGWGADLAADPPPRPATCTVEGCGRRPHARGLCSMHMMRRRCRGEGADLAARGNPAAVAPPLPPGAAACAVDGCGRAAHCRGLCTMHYSRLKRLGDPGEASPRKWRAGGGLPLRYPGFPVLTPRVMPSYNPRRFQGREQRVSRRTTRRTGMTASGTAVDMRSLRRMVRGMQEAGIPVVSLLPGDVAAGDTVSRAMLAGAKAAEQAAEEREEGEAA